MNQWTEAGVRRLDECRGYYGGCRLAAIVECSGLY